MPLSPPSVPPSPTPSEPPAAPAPETAEVGVSFLADGNSSDYTNETLLEISLAVAEAAGVDAGLIDVDVEEFEAEVDADLVQGNLTLAAELSDINATDLADDLAATWNISTDVLEIELVAASVRLAYTVRLPNCTAAAAEYEEACAGADDAEAMDEALHPDAEALLAMIEATGEERLSQRLRVPVTVPAVPRRRREQYRMRSARLNVRIRSLSNTSDAADTAATLTGGLGGGAPEDIAILASAAALETALASRGVAIRVRGKPAVPRVFHISPTGRATQVVTSVVSHRTRFPLYLRAGGIATIPISAPPKSGWRTRLILAQKPHTRCRQLPDSCSLGHAIVRAESINGGPWAAVRPFDCSNDGCAPDRGLLTKLVRCQSARGCSVHVPHTLNDGIVFVLDLQTRRVVPPPSPMGPTPVQPPPPPSPDYDRVLNPPNSARTYSSLLSEHESYVNSNEGDATLDSCCGWRANFGNTWPDFYTTMDVGVERSISGAVMQKRGSQWTTRYTVDVCALGSEMLADCSWVAVDEGAAFVGNTDEDGAQDYALALFASPVTTRFVRIHPKTWTGFMAMRVGLLAYDLPPSPPLPPLAPLPPSPPPPSPPPPDIPIGDRYCPNNGEELVRSNIVGDKCVSIAASENWTAPVGCIDSIYSIPGYNGAAFLPIEPVLTGECFKHEAQSSAWKTRIEECPISGVTLSGATSRHSAVVVSNGRGDEYVVSRIVYMSSNAMRFRMNSDSERMMEADGGILKVGDNMRLRNPTRGSADTMLLNSDRMCRVDVLKPPSAPPTPPVTPMPQRPPQPPIAPPSPPQPPMWPPFDEVVNPLEKYRVYSSVLNDNVPAFGNSMLDANKAWIPQTCAGGCWVQIDLGEERRVSGVVTQPRGDHGDHRVTTFNVQVCATGQLSLGGRSCSEWVAVDEYADFAGPQASNVEAEWRASADERVYALFSTYVTTRYVRIFPKTWNGYHAMRAGVLVVQSPPSPPAPPAVPPMPSIPLLGVQEGTLSLDVSTAGELHRLVKVRDDKQSADAVAHWPIPVARSYDGEPWEALYVPSGEEPVLVVGCADGACTLTLPTASGYKYRVEVLTAAVDGADSSPPTALELRKRTAAKLLMQSTFGATREELTSLTARLDGAPEADVIKDWLVEQVKTPPSLHRTFYRERATFRPKEGIVGHLACAPMSLWQRWSINMRDVDKNLTVSLESTTLSVRVDGQLRTQMNSESEHWSDFIDTLGLTEGNTFTGLLCNVMERAGRYSMSADITKGGGIHVTTNNVCNNNQYFSLPNPPVNFVTPVDPTSVLVLGSADEATLEPMPNIGRCIQGAYGGTLAALPTWDDLAVMTSIRAPCTLSFEAQSMPGAGFLVINGTAYMHDPRWPTFDNSLESPARQAESPLAAQQSLAVQVSSDEPRACHNVPKTFLNSDTCVPSAACSPISFRATGVLLNGSTLTTMHELSKSYIYAVDGLQLDQNADSPCIGTARWRKLSITGGCGVGETPLDAATKATLAESIRSCSDANNPFVRDAVANSISGGSCTSSSDGVSAIGAKVDVDGECWEHTHPHYYDVFEMNEWAASGHPGNAMFPPSANPIKAFAQAGKTTLTFPASHPTTRFMSALSGFAHLGKLGDTVDFRNLPSSVQNVEVAMAFDALDLGAVSESCGSPGEVAYNPLKGHHFWLDHSRYAGDGWVRNTYFPLGKYYGHSREILLEHALHAPDQLRQRAAHALLQVYVISYFGLDFLWNSECWVNYHDILVRNAFGNLRNILMEVSYSPMCVVARSQP